MNTPLSSFVSMIRADRGLLREVPDFDPNNGNEAARYLFVLEAPGPRAVATGFVSFDNPDQTARNLRDQLKDAGINRKDIAIWNIVPWYVGNDDQNQIRAVRPDEIATGTKYLKQLLPRLPELRCIVLVGGEARRAHVPLSAETAVRIVSCHHPSQRAMNEARKLENIKIFRFIRESSE